MSYQDVGMRNTLGNSYGTIPEDVYFRKIASSPYSYEEAATDLDTHFRSTLIDTKPDTPLFASDVPRYDNHSEERLNLRYGGARSTEDPYLPDGTFLDHEFVQRDPRGVDTGPDMRKHYKQQMARASLIKLHNDNDYSIPESGINPTTMSQKIRGTFQRTKSLYKVFDDSLTGWHNGGVAKQQRTGGSDIARLEQDGVILDISEAAQRNRLDPINHMSNNPAIAFRHAETDHRFKIARYNTIRPMASLSGQNWNNNKRSTYVDHKVNEMNNEVRNKMLAELIVDLQAQRNTRLEVTKGTDYGNSRVSIVGKARLHPAEIHKVMLIGINRSQGATPHEAFEGALHIRKYGEFTPNGERELAREVSINHEMLESMQLSNIKVRDRNLDDIRAMRDVVTQSAAQSGVFIEGMTRVMGKYATNTGARESMDTRYIEETKEVQTYGGMKPAKQRNQNIDYDQSLNNSRSNKMSHARRKGHSLKTTDDYDQEQDQGLFEFGTYDRAENMTVERTKGRGTDRIDAGDISLDGKFGQFGTIDLAELAQR